MIQQGVEKIPKKQFATKPPPTTKRVRVPQKPLEPDVTLHHPSPFTPRLSNPNADATAATCLGRPRGGLGLGQRLVLTHLDDDALGFSRSTRGGRIFCYTQKQASSKRKMSERYQKEFFNQMGSNVQFLFKTLLIFIFSTPNLPPSLL